VRLRRTDGRRRRLREGRGCCTERRRASHARSARHPGRCAHGGAA
jgi:hypothetical protein